MIVKHIVVTLKPGMRAAFLEAQAVWNRGMAAHPGCLGGWVSDHPQDPRRIEITAEWAVNKRFMLSRSRDDGGAEGLALRTYDLEKKE